MFAFLLCISSGGNEAVDDEPTAFSCDTDTQKSCSYSHVRYLCRIETDAISVLQITFLTLVYKTQHWYLSLCSTCLPNTVRRVSAHTTTDLLPHLYTFWFAAYQREQCPRMHQGPGFSAAVCERMRYRDWQSSINTSNKPRMLTKKGQIDQRNPQFTIPTIPFFISTELYSFAKPFST